jgi:ABC-type polysaccharide/polyol phosphate transport system ATPase subunit
MASIVLENVTADFPIYGMHRTLRKDMLARLKKSADNSASSTRVVVRALRDINLQLRNGDRLGLIGHNGAGKTTMLRVLAGIYTPNCGQIRVEGRVSTLFITSPGLDPEDTGYENIQTCGRFLGMSKKEIIAKLPEIEEFSELGDHLALPVRTYSTGMLTRLGFAVATAIDPDILLLDEGLSAGDARFAERAKERVEKLVSRTNILVFASHSESMIKEMCNRAILLNHGELVADGDPNAVIAEYHERLKRPAARNFTVADATGAAMI